MNHINHEITKLKIRYNFNADVDRYGLKLNELMEFISLNDFYHLDVFSAIPADCKTYSVQKS